MTTTNLVKGDPVRRLYDLTVQHNGRDRQVITTHLDLEHDEVKLRDLLFDACRRNGDRAERVGEYTLIVREHGERWDTVMTYVTTEVS